MRKRPANFVDLQLLRNLPPRGSEREQLFEETREQFFYWFSDHLSIEDQARLQSAIRSAPGVTLICELIATLPSAVARRFKEALDGLIIEQARTIGVRVFLSRDVLDRVLHWEGEPEGPRLLRHLTDELLARVTPGARVPLSPKLRLFRTEMIGEIKQLKTAIRTRFPERRSPTNDALLYAIFETVRDPNSPYDRLRANQAPLEDFVRGNEDKLRALILNGRITPTVFIGEFMAHSMNRDPEALRQGITRIPKPSQA